MKIKRITTLKKNAIADLNVLLKQFPRDYRVKPDYFKKLIKHSYVFGMFDGEKVVGTVTLVDVYKISGYKASIEHVIIHKDYRGMGLGRKLMDYVISFAKKKKAEAVFLTTSQDNSVANALYKKIGFELKKLNFYQLELKKK